MKTKLTQSMLILFLIVGLFVMGAGRAEAKNQDGGPWSSGNLVDLLAYHWSWGGSGSLWGWGEGWAVSLANPNVSVTYSAQLRNVDTGELLLDGASIPMGTHLKFEVKPYQDTDISWFGLGYSEDSPYGHWVSGANPPAYGCIPDDIVTLGATNSALPSDFDWMAGTYGYDKFVWARDVYIPLNINPPTYTISHDASKLTCDASGINCEVIGSGLLNSAVNFGNTFGKFYYRYDGGSYIDIGCAVDNNAMRTIAGWYPLNGFDFWLEPKVSSSDFVFTVPAQTITFNLTAVSNNNNPTPPTVTPQPFTGSNSTAYPFSFTATDPDGDQIAYEVDWNNDGITDQSTGFVSSGTSQSLSNPMEQWPIAGTYSFEVRTKDNQGGVSVWATPSATVVSVVTGVCGLASGFSFDTLTILSPALCATGTPASFLSTGTGWTWGCNDSGGGASTLPNACSATINTYTLTAVKNLGPAAAGTIIDTTPTGTSIDSTAIPSRNSEIIPYGASRTLRANPNSSSVSWSGCTSVSGNDCTIANITSAKTVAATFTRLAEPGVCGSANGQSFETLTTASSGICASGAITGFSLSGTAYSWGCNGSFGSTVNVSCSATQLRNYNWTEGTP